SQLTGLTIHVPDNVTTTLQVVAVAGSVTSTPLQIPLTVKDVPPTLTATGSVTVFNPMTGGVSVSVAASDPGNDVIQSVTINWGDGTVQTIAGPPTTYTHQYPILDHAYTVAISVNEADGTFQVPVDPQFDAVIPDPTSAVVAKLYVDVLGRTADVGGLMN